MVGDVITLHGPGTCQGCGNAILNEEPVNVNGAIYHGGCVPSAEEATDIEWDSEPVEYCEAEDASTPGESELDEK